MWEDYSKNLGASSLPKPIKPTKFERRMEKKDKEQWGQQRPASDWRQGTDPRKAAGEWRGRKFSALWFSQTTGAGLEKEGSGGEGAQKREGEEGKAGEAGRPTRLLGRFSPKLRGERA